MANITISFFTFNSTFNIRYQIINGQPWFLANDICTVLEYSNPWDALRKHVFSEDLAKREGLAEDGKIRQMSWINESGLYSLILRSKMARAQEFQRWVTSEVLPSLRQYGYYALPQQQALPISEPKTELLDNATMTAIRKYIWELGRVTWYEQSFSNAVWCALRKATNTPSPQVFAVKDVDKLIKVLRKVTSFIASYYNFKNNTEKELFKKIIIEGAPLAELDSELAKFQIEEKECKDFTRSFSKIEAIFKSQKELITYKG